MPSMNISPPRLSTGTTARILNGLCRYLTGADEIEDDSGVNFLSYYPSAIADERTKLLSLFFLPFPL